MPGRNDRVWDRLGKAALIGAAVVALLWLAFPYRRCEANSETRHAGGFRLSYGNDHGRRDRSEWSTTNRPSLPQRALVLVCDRRHLVVRLPLKSQRSNYTGKSAKSKSAPKRGGRRRAASFFTMRLRGVRYGSPAVAVPVRRVRWAPLCFRARRIVVETDGNVAHGEFASLDQGVHLF